MCICWWPPNHSSRLLIILVALIGCLLATHLYNRLGIQSRRKKVGTVGREGGGEREEEGREGERGESEWHTISFPDAKKKAYEEEKRKAAAEAKQRLEAQKKLQKQDEKAAKVLEADKSTYTLLSPSLTLSLHHSPSPPSIHLCALFWLYVHPLSLRKTTWNTKEKAGWPRNSGRFKEALSGWGMLGREGGGGQEQRGIHEGFVSRGQQKDINSFHQIKRAQEAHDELNKRTIAVQLGNLLVSSLRQIKFIDWTINNLANPEQQKDLKTGIVPLSSWLNFIWQ